MFFNKNISSYILGQDNESNSKSCFNTNLGK